MKGFYLTCEGYDSSIINHEPEFDFRDLFGYAHHGRHFINRFRIAIDTTGYTVDPTDTVFHYKMVLSEIPSDISYYKYVTKSDFGTANLEWKEFYIDSGFADEDYLGNRTQFFTDNIVDVYVDWVEYMDREQGYYLWWDDDTTAVTLQKIAEQCNTLQTYEHGDAIAGWAQSDEPPRCFFESHGKICDYFTGHDTLDGYWPQAVLNASWNKRRPDHFVRSGHPKIFEINLYVFDSTGTLGMQSELDTLISYLEWTYQACGDTIPVHFTGQCYGYHEGYSGSHRNPTRSEIFAEAYIALAHGAKGINFYTYRSDEDDDGLVDTNYEHNDPPFAEKWQAVQDVFTQLDSIGPTLLSLNRTAAYCAKDGGFQSPITNIEFSDDNVDWIEAGQFDSAGVDFLILVNRRTNYDRHINVETDMTSGTNALRDVYTLEQFVSSTGDFKGIPFDSGEGRVFRIEEDFNDWTWDNDDNIVLADTVHNTTQTPNVISVNLGPRDGNTTIRATKEGVLKFNVGKILDCNGQLIDTVVFTALEPDEGWKGLYFNASRTDTLAFTKVEHVDGRAVKMRGTSTVIIRNSKICQNDGAGIDCEASRLTMKNCEVSDNTSMGILMGNSSVGTIYDCDIFDNADAGIFLYEASTPEIGRCEVHDNGWVGVVCADNGTDPVMLYNQNHHPHGGYNVIVDNGSNGVYAFGGLPHLGLNANSQGQNHIYGHASGNARDVSNTSNEDTVFARYNWWGTPEPQDSQFYGAVDYSNWLTQGGEGFTGWPPIIQNKQKENMANSGGPEGPNIRDLDEAYRLNNVAVELFLNGEYYAAIDTFQLVINGYPGTTPARFALNHTVVSYREAEDYEGAVEYLNDFLQELPDSNLVDLALYHKVLNLAWLQEYQSAVAIAGNAQLVQSWSQNLIEPTMIELGMIQKYGLQNVAVGDSVFRAFLEQYPESHLAPIAAMELGIPWEPRGTSGSDIEGALGIGNKLPEEFSLRQNFPNPFNLLTTIRYDLPEISEVTLRIYNIMGREVATLVDRKETAGYKRVSWSGSNRYGGELSSGMYILQMVAKGESGRKFVRVKKMLLIK